MQHSERLALMALLAKHRPSCSVEVGRYHGGSLSVLAEYSTSVISVAIDPDVPHRLKGDLKVSFVTGESATVLPLLFAEMDRKGLSTDFILLDGDHSTEGVKRDIEAILKYVPRTPLFVMLHDSFNPDCRRGIVESDWAGSPYCHWVDLDFVPGCLVADEGPVSGQLWGGLAMAYFLPEPQRRNVIIQRSAERTFQCLNNLGSTENI